MVQYHLSGTLANQWVGRAELSVPTMTDVMWATAAADLQVCVPLGTLRYMASLDGTDCAALVAEALRPQGYHILYLGGTLCQSVGRARGKAARPLV